MRAQLVLFLLAGCVAKDASLRTKQHEALQITTKCHVAAKTIVLKPNGEMHIRPKPTESYEHADCVLNELKKSEHLRNVPTGFVGNEKYDENMH